MIVADSNAWVDLIRRPNSGLGQVMKQLLEAERVVMVGTVLAELLRGLRANTMPGTEELLVAMPFAETTKGAWIRAGQIARSLEEAGTPVPLNDLVIAAQVLEDDHELLTRDKHFERVPDLRLYDWRDDDA